MDKISPRTKIIISQILLEKVWFCCVSCRRLLLRNFGAGVKKIIASGIFTLGILFVPSAVLAATDITVDFPNSPGPMITETNILPGNVFTRTVTITKLNDADKALMLRLDRKNLTGTYNLESKILMKIQRLSDNMFLNMPNATKEDTLENFYNYIDAANSDAYQFDTISGIANLPFQYKFWFTFDPATGNDYQGKSTTFDILMGIYTTSVDTNDDDDGGGHHNNNGGGGGGGAGGGGAGATPGIAGLAGGGIGTPGVNETPVEIETTQEKPPLFDIFSEPIQQCHGWPLWVWILALVIFTLNFWRNARKNYRLEEYGWKVALAWTVAGAVFWYYFDFCRQYRWFLYGAIIIAIVSHFVYLYYLRKKVNEIKKNPETIKNKFFDSKIMEYNKDNKNEIIK